MQVVDQHRLAAKFLRKTPDQVRADIRYAERGTHIMRVRMIDLPPTPGVPEPKRYGWQQVHCAHVFNDATMECVKCKITRAEVMLAVY